MKLTVKLYRVTTIRTEDLVGAIGEKDDPGAELGNLIKTRFYPHPPRFHIFFPDTSCCSKTVVGMEIMAFDLEETGIPMAGLVLADPMSPQDIDRIDGAIESELNRMNIFTDFLNYEYRVAYERKGN